MEQLSVLARVLWAAVARSRDGILTKALAKLAYFVDLRSATETGRTLTGATWRFDDFGPFTPEVYAATDELVAAHLIGIQHRTSPQGYQYRVHRALRSPDLHALFDAGASRLVDETLTAFNGLDGEVLQEIAYTTAPIVYAKRGEVLDMERDHRKRQHMEARGVPVKAIQERLRARKRTPSGTPEQRAEQDRKVMEEMAALRRTTDA